jgi:hypothetical protein
MMKQSFVKWLLMAMLMPMSAAVYAGFVPQGGTFMVNGINYCVTSENPLLCEVAPGPYEGAITIEDEVTNIITTYEVKRVGEEAFAGNTGLTEVTLSENIESIGEKAFDGCTGLTKVTILNPVPGQIAANAIDKTVPIYVPKGTKADYLAADGWKDLNIKEEGETAELKGDANLDKKIDVRDMATILDAILNGTTDALPAVADVNGDGKIDVRDMAALLNMILGNE